MSTATAEPAKRRRQDARADAPLSDDTTVITLPREEVQRRAYERFIARGGTHGADLDDWLEAEREVLASRSIES